MKKKIIKYLTLSLLVLISIAFGFGLSEYIEIKRRPLMAFRAEYAAYSAYKGKDVSTSEDITITLKNLYLTLYWDPSNVRAHFTLGSLFYDQGLYNLSLYELEKYLQNPISRKVRGFSKTMDKMQEDFDKHDIAQAYCYIGDIYDIKGNNKNALTNYRKAIELDPGYKKFLEVYIKVITEKKEKEKRDLIKLEELNKRLSKLKKIEAET